MAEGKGGLGVALGVCAASSSVREASREGEECAEGEGMEEGEKLPVLLPEPEPPSPLPVADAVGEMSAEAEGVSEAAEGEEDSEAWLVSESTEVGEAEKVGVAVPPVAVAEARALMLPPPKVPAVTVGEVEGEEDREKVRLRLDKGETEMDTLPEGVMLALGLLLTEMLCVEERVRAPTLPEALVLPTPELSVARALKVGVLVGSVPLAEVVRVTLELPEEVELSTSLGLGGPP